MCISLSTHLVSCFRDGPTPHMAPWLIFFQADASWRQTSVQFEGPSYYLAARHSTNESVRAVHTNTHIDTHSGSSYGPKNGLNESIERWPMGSLLWYSNRIKIGESGIDEGWSHQGMALAHWQNEKRSPVTGRRFPCEKDSSDTWREVVHLVAISPADGLTGRTSARRWRYSKDANVGPTPQITKGAVRTDGPKKRTELQERARQNAKHRPRRRRRDVVCKSSGGRIIIRNRAHTLARFVTTLCRPICVTADACDRYTHLPLPP